MLNIIQNLLRLLFGKKTAVNQTKNLSDNSEYIGGISFKLTKNSDIDVMYSLPEVTTKTSDEILDVADRYAKFLMAINQGYLQEDIIEIFYSNLKPNDDAKSHLLLDNILVFWGMAELEAQKRLNNTIKKQQPLVRPSSVFNRDNH